MHAFKGLYFIDQIENAGRITDRPEIIAPQAIEAIRAAEEVQELVDG